MDFFKVVLIPSTQEVEPVPHRWEDGGILFWPPLKTNVRKLQPDASSYPKPGWVQYKCLIKENHISNYEEALQKADYHCFSYTSESDDSDFMKARKNKKPQNINVYDEIIDSINEPNPDIVNNNDIYVATTEADVLAKMELVGKNFEISILADIDSRFSKIAEEIDHGFEMVMAKLDTRLTRLETLFQSFISETPGPLPSNSILSIFPLSSYDDVENLENNLKGNDDFRKNMLIYLKRIIGTAQKWRIAAYKLCDFIFEKNLLTQYSWTGISRENNKKQFQSLAHTLDLFFDVVFNADISFSHKLRDEFFRDGVLKHSVERTQTKIKRKSDGVLKQVDKKVDKKKAKLDGANTTATVNIGDDDNVDVVPNEDAEINLIDEIIE